MQCFRTIAHDVESAAFQGTILGEGGNDHMAAGFDRMHYILHIALPVLRVGKKMEHSAVVSHVHAGFGQQHLGDVCHLPVHLGSPIAHILP